MSPRHQPHHADDSQDDPARPRPRLRFVPFLPRPSAPVAIGLAVAVLTATALAALWITVSSSPAPPVAAPSAPTATPDGDLDPASPPTGDPPSSGAPSPVPSPSASAGTPAPTPEPTPPATQGGEDTEAKRPPDGRSCPGHPTPACTGVPPGTRLTRLALNEGGAYRVTERGTVLDGVHIPGDLLIVADDVVIRNSRIDGSLSNEYKLHRYSFTIADSTVGPPKGCLTAPGVGEARFTAERVHIRGHGDGFHASGDDIEIRDSYVRLCSNPGDHSDGIQTYLAGKGLVFDHNTVDQRFAKDITAPIFITDEQAEDVTVTRNLVMGGTYSIQVKNVSGRAVVRDNRLVDRSWVYGPVEADCATVEWSGNTLVTIDDDYRITSTVGPLPCAT
ncbi:hypothetical protein AB0K60_26400 [Thermopolyspora sp. NPDC052614]|uniref:hypothetical protein n=1 Tax=Thermopolyspora sp. NPDC052614 TaxID=3155682 RepID=UPI0034483E7E